MANTFAARMQAAAQAQIAADKADANGDTDAARNARLEAFRATAAASREAEVDRARNR
jgi:hypothetical protein